MIREHDHALLRQLFAGERFQVTGDGVVSPESFLVTVVGGITYYVNSRTGNAETRPQLIGRYQRMHKGIQCVETLPRA